MTQLNAEKKTQANLSVRVDSKDKQAFEAFCDQAGMNVSVAINMFVKEVIREQRLPFIVKADPFYSAENMKRLRRSIAQMEATGGTVHELVDIDDD